MAANGVRMVRCWVLGAGDWGLGTGDWGLGCELQAVYCILNIVYCKLYTYISITLKTPPPLQQTPRVSLHELNALLLQSP